MSWFLSPQDCLLPSFIDSKQKRLTMLCFCCWLFIIFLRSSFSSCPWQRSVIHQYVLNSRYWFSWNLYWPHIMSNIITCFRQSPTEWGRQNFSITGVQYLIISDVLRFAIVISNVATRKIISARRWSRISAQTTRASYLMENLRCPIALRPISWALMMAWKKPTRLSSSIIYLRFYIRAWWWVAYYYGW